MATGLISRGLYKFIQNDLHSLKCSSKTPGRRPSANLFWINYGYVCPFPWRNLLVNFFPTNYIFFPQVFPGFTRVLENLESSQLMSFVFTDSYLSGPELCEPVSVFRRFGGSRGSDCFLTGTCSFFSRMEIHSARCVNTTSGNYQYINGFVQCLKRRNK